MPPPAPRLVVEGLRLVVEGLRLARGERGLVEGLALAVEPGGALLLTGPNGSGKSTLLRALAGLHRPAAGRVALEGCPEPLARAHHLLGHRDGARPGLAAGEQAAFARAFLGPSFPGMAEGAGVAEALARVGLGAAAALPVAALSAGQRRRLALARLLTCPRPLWLLDEPAAALDAAALALLAHLCAAHRAAGGLVVAATHQPLGLPGAAELALGGPPHPPPQGEGGGR